MSTIRVIDFETTGFEPPEAVVCEAAYCDLMRQSDDSWVIGSPQSWLCAATAIPPEVRAVHHITLADLEGAEPFNPGHVLGGTVIAAHNMEFEAKFLGEHKIPTLCTYKAALRVWPDAPSHSNGALRYWLEDQGLISLDHAFAYPPHRAGPDTYVTAHILSALLKFVTARDMVAWTKEPRLLPTCPIGKERGKKWADVDAGFLKWMTEQTTMEADLKWNARREIERRAEAAK